MTTSSILVRQAKPEDFSTVLALVGTLLTELGEEGDETGELAVDHLTSLCQKLGDSHVVFMAETQDGSAVGVLTLSETFAIYANGCYGVINEMYVVPEHRSSMIGAGLVEAAARHGRSRGWRRIDVTAPESERWVRTRRFYENLGFVFTGPKLKLMLDDD